MLSSLIFLHCTSVCVAAPLMHSLEGTGVQSVGTGSWRAYLLGTAKVPLSKLEGCNPCHSNISARMSVGPLCVQTV